MRKKILIVGPSPSHIGGVSTFTQSILNSSLSERYEISCFDILSDEFLAGNLISKIIKKFWMFIKYTNFLIGNSITLVHINSSSYQSFWFSTVFLILSKVYSRKVVLRIGSGLFKEFSLTHPLRYLIKLILHIPDRVIVLSKGWALFFRNQLGIFRISILNNGVLSSNFSTNTESIVLPEVLKGKKVFSFLGSLEEKKGVFDIINVFSGIIKENPSVMLILGGEAPNSEVYQKLKNLIRNLNIEKYLYLYGAVSGKEKIKLLKASHIFVFPSYAEGFPNALLEAMAAGLPVVSTTVGAIPELIEDGRNGFLISPGDLANLKEKLLTLLENETLRRKMGEENMRKVRENYDIEIIAQRLSSIYDSVMSNQQCPIKLKI